MTGDAGLRLAALAAWGVAVGGLAAPAAGQQDCVDPRPSGVTLCGNAADWAAQNPGFEARAFDEFHPGLVAGTGCVAGPPGPTLPLATGTVEARGYDAADAEGCALLDGSNPSGQVSDGLIDTGGSFELLFDPPVVAFYTYFGSLAPTHTVTFELFDELGASVDAIQSSSSSDAVAALGYGFRSSVPISRIAFRSSESGTTLVGAFVRLAAGADSLGTVTIPGYQGPDEGDGVETIELDFAVVLDDCNGNGVADSVDIASGTSQDQDGDGTPDECEACLHADDTLDCNDNGVIDGCEAIVIEADDPQYATLQEALDAACVGDRVVVRAGRVQPASSSQGIVEVTPGTLVLEEGATLEFPAGGLLRIGDQGALLVEGTELAPVRLVPEPGGPRWNGIQLRHGASATLRHARIEQVSPQGLRVEDATVEVESVAIEDVLGGVGAASGIRLDHPDAAATIANTSIVGVLAQDGADGPDGAVGDPGDRGGDGQDGSPAFGIAVELGTATISSATIEDIRAGSGGRGGRGGNGDSPPCCQGGNGGRGGWGGPGGWAFGIRDAGSPPAQIRDVVVRGIVAGAGGDAGGGGNRGLSIEDGFGGDGGMGGRGGSAWGIHGADVLLQSLVHLVRAGNGGDGGDGGSRSFPQPGQGGGGGDGGSPTGLASAAAVLAHHSVVGLVAGEGGEDGLGSGPGPGTDGRATGFEALGGGAHSFENNLLWRVVPPFQGDISFAAQATGGGSIQAAYNCVQGFSSFSHASWTATATGDPRFVDRNGDDNVEGNGDDDLRLRSGSPCVDSGDNGAVPAALALDLEGKPRRQDDPATADGGAGSAPIVDRGAYELPEPGALAMLAAGAALLVALQTRRGRR